MTADLLSFEQLLARFSGPRKPNGSGGFNVKCPVHAGKRNVSLSISPGNSAGPLLYCFAGCKTESVLSAVGLTWQNILLPGEPPRKPAPRAASRELVKTTRYEIQDVAGRHIFHHVRKDYIVDGKPEKEMYWDPKPTGLGVKLANMKLYGVERLPEDAQIPVIVCEGEKATDALLSNGIPAVGTITGAAGTPGDDALRPLLDHFKVALWSDNDDGGRKHMAKIGKALLRLGHDDVRVVEWKQAPPEGDAADLFAMEGATDEFQELMDTAQPFEWAREKLVPPVEQYRGEAAAVGRLESFRGTDLWSARLFVHLHGDKVRYCERLGGWYIYDGKRWIRSQCGEVERLAKQTAREIYKMAVREEDDGKRQALAKHAGKSEAAKKLTAMLMLASSEEGIAVPPEVFDAQPWLFNAANGTLNLITGEPLPHRPEDMLTNISPAEWRGLDAKAERFAQFLFESFDGDRERIDFLQRVAGYTLSADMREQVFNFLHGPEAAGKGTFIRAVADAMGTYGRSADIATFLTSRQDKVRNDIAALVGARMVTAGEPEDGQSFDEGLIKLLTGQDRTSARFLFRENFEFTATFKLWFQGNHRPHIRSTGGAMWRRLLIIPFTRTVPEEKRDKLLGEKLRTPEERAGILAWMVRGCLEWQRGGLRPPNKVRAAVAEYRKAEDRLAPFLEECTIEDPSGQVPAGELYTRYRTWAEGNGERPIAKRSLGMRLEEKGYNPGRTTRGARAWGGLILVDREEGT